MKSTQLFVFFLFPFTFIQLTSNTNFTDKYDTENSINHFDITKNSFAVLKDTSEYEVEIIYNNRKEIAKNVYNFQRRIVYNNSELRINKPATEFKNDENLVLTKEERNCFEKIEKLKDIYFDLGKFTIRKDAQMQINKVALIMGKCPKLEFVASSYTDSRGSSRYNKSLSQLRANAVINYISNNYDVSAKITGKGYGETGLKNHCSNGVKCTKKQHQVNRRTEIKLSYK